MNNLNIKSENEGVSLQEGLLTIFPLLHDLRNSISQIWKDGVSSIPQPDNHMIGIRSVDAESIKTKTYNKDVFKPIYRRDSFGDR